MDDLTGKNGLMKKPIQDMMKLLLEVKMEEHLDRKRYVTVCNDLDNKIISLYARGLTVSDIRSELRDLYVVNISESMVSKITDKVMASADEWQNRMLDSVYPIVFMDAIHYKVWQDGKIVNKAAYVCMGINMEGYKDILGIWIGENESSKFGLSVCNN